MEAVLKIFGDIGDTLPESYMGEGAQSITPELVAQFLDDNKDAEKIIVRINSRGGDVTAGWYIHDLLVNSGKQIKTIGESKIYSIATIIFLAGSEREIFANADGLIHNPFIPQYTLADAYESSDLLKIAESLKQEEEKILNFYADKTGADRSKLAEYMKEDTKLSAKDMLSLGFATKIIEPIKAFAYYKPKINTMDEKAFFEKLGLALDGAVAKMFSRLPVTDQTLTDKDGKELKLEKETGAPVVGDKATPDGTFEMASGLKVTVANGVVTECDEDETELDKANKKIDELEAKVAQVEASKNEVILLRAADEKKITDAENLVTELTALKNSWTPAGRVMAGNNKKPGGFDLERAKEIAKKMESETIKTE
jgi:ATP-dependent protease ClpP protease subunit